MPETELICLIGNTKNEKRYSTYAKMLASRENTAILNLLTIENAMHMEAVPEKNRYAIIKFCLDLCNKIAVIPAIGDEDENLGGKTCLARAVMWRYIYAFPGMPIEDLPEIEEEYE